ncbi:MAG: hypothetical protein UDP17_12395 [Treponema sp.]|uniref:hypothetical protein n=1 Tax=uncultured Treponema sp. TaxID=162155 RepID=UPI0025F4368C|nr:hypothetical protein [uncultured Treponema sp.]MEE0354130.1 hypothetical protein [Treponema sp.]
MEYFDYMRKKFECAFKFKEFCDALNKCRIFGSKYNEYMLLKESDFYNSCNKLPPQERDLFKSFGNMAIFLSGCGVIL